MQRPGLAWTDLLPSWRNGAAVVLMFAVAALVAREAGPWLEREGARHVVLGMALFLVTSVIAVLAPMLTNLPLVPFAAMAYDPIRETVVLFGWNIGRSPPVAPSMVAASKSNTPSNVPLSRMNAFSCRRVASAAGVP